MMNETYNDLESTWHCVNDALTYEKQLYTKYHMSIVLNEFYQKALLLLETDEDIERLNAFSKVLSETLLSYDFTKGEKNENRHTS